MRIQIHFLRILTPNQNQNQNQEDRRDFMVANQLKFI